LGVKLAVIADDLTGSNDTGVQYSKQGLETIVVTKLENIAKIKDRAEVIVIDSESRADKSENAYSKVKKAAEVIKKIGIEVVYKKIDSTLRGNIGQELDAIMDVFKYDLAILVPAFPANRRITIGGHQLVNQVPLNLTEISKDPLTPVKESHVPTLLRKQTKRNVMHIPLSKVMNPSDLAEELKKIKKEKSGIVIIDAVTQNDLKTIAKTLSIVGLERLTSGPAGLAEEMPEALGFVTSKPAVLISGSISEVTMRQINKIEESLGIESIKLDVNKIIKEEELRNKEIDRVLKNVKANISKKMDSIITSAISKEAVEKNIEFGSKLGLSSVEISKEIATTFGEIANKIAGENIAGLILTGGSIAISALKAMDALGVKVTKEIMPGIPRGIVIGGKFDGLKVITKAGAFGDEFALLNCLKQLKRSE